MHDPETPAPTKPLPLPLTGMAGLCMGAADAVPGVSGGTIALILGVYQRLIDSIGKSTRQAVASYDREKEAADIAEAARASVATASTESGRDPRRSRA